MLLFESCFELLFHFCENFKQNIDNNTKKNNELIRKSGNNRNSAKYCLILPCSIAKN